MAISSTLVLGVMFLILGLLLSIPFLHLKTMGAKDPLRMSHVLTIILAAFLGTGAFTFLVLDLAVYDEGKSTLHKSTESSAKRMKEKVHGELRNILSTLTHFDQSQYLKNDKEKILIGHESGTRESVGQRSVVLEVFEQENPQTQPNRQCNALPIAERQQCYPDFLNVFWMDRDGSLRVNWAQTEARGVFTNVSFRSRDYAKNVLDAPGDLWTISQQSEQDESEAKNYRFFLEPIISWTTGENTVVASMASQNDQQQPNGWVAAMEFKFVSLMDKAILPPGIGFAVIENDTHRVLFHSKEGRNLREDFLVETDHNQQLRDLFTARTEGHVDGSYWGKARSFYTLPLEPLPWALVVYRDREILQSVNLFGLVIAGGIYGLWSLAVYFIAWIMLRLNSKHRKAVCLWPNAADHFQYVNLIKSNLVVFVVGLYSLWMLSGHPGWQLVTALLIIPSSCLILAWILVKKFPQKGEPSLPSLRNSYVYLATSFLLIFAVIPAFGCFSSVFHKEMTILTQYQILETFKGFQNSDKPTITSSTRFQKSDLLDPKGIILKLREFHGPNDRISENIYSQLFQNTKTLSINDNNKDHSSGQIKPLQNALTKELNVLVSPKPSFIHQPINKIIPYKDSELDNMKYELIYPNSRLLLEDVFPEEILRTPRTFEAIPLNPDCGTLAKRGNESYGFYPNFFLTTTWSKCANTDTSITAEPEYFDQFFALASQPFLPLLKNVPLWGFLGESLPENKKPNDYVYKENQATSQDSIDWMTWEQGLIGYFKDSQIVVSAELPLQPWFLSGKEPTLSFFTPGKTIKIFLLIGLFMIWIVTIPKFIAIRTVFLNYPTPFKVPQELLFTQPSNGSSWSNQLILGFPGQGKTPKALPLEKEKKKQYPLYFDLKAIPPEEWKKEFSKEISSLNLSDDQNLHVIIDHLERQWKDPAINFKKLELMEWLLNRSNHQKDTSKSTTNENQTQTSQNSKLGDLIIQVLTKLVSHEKS